MKSKNLIWKIVLLISVILLVVSCQYFLKGCLWWNCVPQRPFHILDWELSEDMFPKDAYASSLTPSSEGAGEIERGSQVIYWNEDSSFAEYDIKRYPLLMMRFVSMNINSEKGQRKN